MHKLSAENLRCDFPKKYNKISFLYARHLTDVLWYGAVRPSVRSVVHNPCGQDIARTIWPRMLKLSMYT